MVVFALALGFLGATAMPATADEANPPGSTSQPGDPFGGQTVPPGPVFIITPGTGATELPAPADPEDVQAQIDKDRESPQGESPDSTPGVADSGAPTAGSTPNASPDNAEEASESSTVSPTSGVGVDQGGSSSAFWWGSGVVGMVLAALGGVLLVARRRRDRASTASLNEHAS